MSNKLKYTIILLASVLVLFSCQPSGFHIIGKISPGYDKQYAMLFTFNGEEIASVDTAIITNGSFHFRGKEYLSDFSVISIGNYPDTVISVDVILEQGNIKIDLTSEPFIVEGTPLNDSCGKLSDFCKYYNRIRRNLYQSGVQQSDSTYQKINQQFCDYKASFIKNNISNIVGKRELKTDCYWLDDDDFNEIYAMASDDVKSDEEIVKAKRYRDRRAEMNTWVGKKFEDFTLTALNGKPKQLSEYFGKSKYLLIDFWASWCGPCMHDMPYLMEAYNKYKDKGFDIVSISFDSDKTLWQQAIKKNKIPWHQLIDTLGVKGSSIAKTYNIVGIPRCILLDNEGKIVQMELIGENLDMILPALYANQK